MDGWWLNKGGWWDNEMMVVWRDVGWIRGEMRIDWGWKLNRVGKRNDVLCVRKVKGLY